MNESTDQASKLREMIAGGSCIECTARIESDKWGNQTAFITSPRTGKTLDVAAGWWNELPAGLIAKIEAAGNSAASFTLDELDAFAALSAKIATHLKPRPRGANTMPAPTAGNSWQKRRFFR